jgi:hypothetical protein
MVFTDAEDVQTRPIRNLDLDLVQQVGEPLGTVRHPTGRGIGEDSRETVDADLLRAHPCPAVAVAVTISTSSASSTASIVIVVSSMITKPSRAPTCLPPTRTVPVAGTR